jgi:chemotaxis protein methyltransferase CheR
MPLPKTDFHYEKLKKKVIKDLGFQTQHYGDTHLRRRFRTRMRAVGVKTHIEYIRFLERHPTEYSKLLNALTVNVTGWFRNPGVFEALKKRVIPDVIKTGKAKNRTSMRLWSIGCSDGKEPYSLAMCVKEVLKEGEDFQVTIFAWDIDEAMLKKARYGVYKQGDLKGLDSRRIKRYFIEENGRYRVRPNIKSMVKFEKKDLNIDKKRTGVDIIMCRNVVIYLNKPRKADLYQELYQCLRPNGYFVMGKSETLIGHARDLFKAVDNKNRIYQK